MRSENSSPRTSNAENVGFEPQRIQKQGFSVYAFSTGEDNRAGACSNGGRGRGAKTAEKADSVAQHGGGGNQEPIRARLVRLPDGSLR